jgi:hypothetical protein
MLVKVPSRLKHPHTMKCHSKWIPANVNDTNAARRIKMRIHHGTEEMIHNNATSVAKTKQNRQPFRTERNLRSKYPAATLKNCNERKSCAAIQHNLCVVGTHGKAA